VKHGWRILIIVRDFGRRVLLVFIGVNRSRGKPRTFGDPDVIELSWLRYREDALRDAGAKSFIDNAEIESHGNGRSFIGTGVVKFSVHHDGNGNKAGFLAVGRKLDQCERARSLVGRGFVAILRRRTLGCQHRTGEPDQYRQNDGEHPVAI